MGVNSYAQNFEDVMLWRALERISNGFYIDVGANHPVIDSVSLTFYERGWRGVHIEPLAEYANLLRQYRPDELVIQAAISDERGLIPFYVMEGLSTCDALISKRHLDNNIIMSNTVVSTVTLEDIFNRVGNRDIHWLKIDVEGFEEKVLKSWGDHTARPWIVVIESTLPLTTIENYHQWEELLFIRDYNFVYFDGLNRFYISKEHILLKKFFATPPNVFDGFTLNGTSNASFHQLIKNQYETKISQFKLTNDNLALENTTLRTNHEKSINEYEVRNKKIIDEFKHTEETLNIHTNSIEKDLLKQKEANAEQLYLFAQKEKEFTLELSKLKEDKYDKLRKIEKNHQEILSQLSKENSIREQNFLVKIELSQTKINKQNQTNIEHLTVLAQREKEFISEIMALRERNDIEQHGVELKHQQTLNELSQAHTVREQNLITQISDLQNELKQQNLLSLEYLQELKQREKEFITEIIALRERNDIEQHGVELKHQQTLNELSQAHTAREQNLITQISGLQNELKQQNLLSLEYLQELKQREKEFAETSEKLHQRIHKEILENQELSALLKAAEQLKAELNSELLDNQKKLGDLLGKIALLQNSFSWRVTSPLRTIGALFSHSTVNSKHLLDSLDIDQQVKEEIPDQQTSIEKENPEPSHTPIIDQFTLQDDGVIMKSHTTAATTLNELLTLYDKDFIHCAYITLLGRTPDPEGMRYYLERLRMGQSKIALINQIVSSPEAKSYSVNVSGLKKAISMYRWTKIPIIGVLIKGINREDNLARQINIIQSSIYRLNKEMNDRLDRIDQQIKELSHPFSTPSPEPSNEMVESNNSSISHLSPTARKIYKMLKISQGSK